MNESQRNWLKTSLTEIWSFEVVWDEKKELLREFPGGQMDDALAYAKDASHEFGQISIWQVTWKHWRGAFIKRQLIFLVEDGQALEPITEISIYPEDN